MHPRSDRRMWRLDLRLVLVDVALLACSGVGRRPRAQRTAAPVALATPPATALDVDTEPTDALVADTAIDAPEDVRPSEDVPSVLPRCADLDPTPESCAASHPGRAFAHCGWSVGPVYACGRRAPPPSARALVCICNGCDTSRDCTARGAGPRDGTPWFGTQCMLLGYPCGPLARVCVNMPWYLRRDVAAYHDDHGHLRGGDPRDYARRTPALRAPCVP